MYNCCNTDYAGLHSTPSNTEHDGFIDMAPSYASWACLLVNAALAASYCTLMMTYPNAVLVLLRASEDIVLN
jgi:hypothetical protein